VREELRAVAHELLEQSELIFQFPTGRVAQALALLCKDVRRNLVSNRCLFRLLWSVQDQNLTGIETALEFSGFLFSRTERACVGWYSKLLAMARIAKTLRTTAFCVAFLAIMVACRLVPDENPDVDLVCWFVHCASSGGEGTRFQKRRITQILATLDVSY